ncbi:MAG: hypothetical protein HOP28_09370 [Gemmatimonadales bacterium]|nr:hypothetical protein [Gemmatimonadales bacterium]
MAARDISVIFRAVDQVTGPVREINNRMKGFADGVTGFFKGMATGIAAFGIMDFLLDSVRQASEAEEGWSRLGTSVKNAGGDFARLRPEIEGVIKDTQRFSVATDDELREALTRMITISGDYRGSLTNLGLAADIAAFKHISVAEAGDLVGKAMQGNEKVFKGFGIVAGTNAEKMEQLRQTVRGFAEGEAQTFSGQLKLIANAWDEVKRATGEAIINNETVRSNLGDVTGMLRSLEEGVASNAESIGVLVTALGGVGSALLWVAGILGQALTGAIMVVQAAVVTFMGV